MMIVAVLALLTGRGLSKPAIVCPADAGNTHALAAAEVQRSIYQRSDTLLPIARQYEATELADLYARRWEIETKLRDVKTTLGMEFFAVRTPDMAHKTLRMMIIAYNLMRIPMQQAAYP